jgi:hypothetical protein
MCREHHLHPAHEVFSVHKLDLRHNSVAKLCGAVLVRERNGLPSIIAVDKMTLQHCRRAWRRGATLLSLISQSHSQNIVKNPLSMRAWGALLLCYHLQVGSNYIALHGHLEGQASVKCHVVHSSRDPYMRLLASQIDLKHKQDSGART